MGAHVWWPWYLEEHWFGQFRLSGWSPDWYAGFPVGQYYFPLPAVLVALARHDPVRLVQRRVQARDGVRRRCCSPRARTRSHAACARRGPRRPRSRSRRTGMLVQTRDNWQIYGGNIASTLAGEFSFTLALALGLFALGALGKTLDTGKRPWLPAVLIARVGDVARRRRDGARAVRARCCSSRAGPLRTWRLALPVGAVAVALTAVWSLPLIAAPRHDAEHAVREGRTRRATGSSGAGSRRCCPARSSARSKASCAASAPSTNAARRGDQAAAVVAVVDLAARGRRDRRGRLLPAPLDARARSSPRSCSACCSSSGPSTRCGTRGSCRSGC